MKVCSKNTTKVIQNDSFYLCSSLLPVKIYFCNLTGVEKGSLFSGLRKVDGSASRTQVPPIVSPVYPSQSAVFAEQKGCGWGYSNRLVAPGPWYTNRMGGPQCTQCPGVCPVPRSSSVPGSSQQVSR